MQAENLTSPPQALPAQALSREALWRAFCDVRDLSERLPQGLTAEDQNLQSMPDASPMKWHLAHTTWFFEVMVLSPHAPRYRPFDPRFATLFNSYYEALGARHPRPQRAMLSRPTLDEVWLYREHVDRAMQAFIGDGADADVTRALPLITLGLHHEQQHQELMLTDIKHAFSLNPLAPCYAEPPESAGEPRPAEPMRWVDCPGGIVQIGHDGAGFGFDNEGPQHPVLLQPYRIGSRPVSCAEYLEFMLDGGYRRPELWLSDGWAMVQSQGWTAPLYWLGEGRSLDAFTLQGQRPLDPAEPVSHIGYYEAAAYAQWADARLPTEFEWEAAARLHALAAGEPVLHRHDLHHPHPVPASPQAGPLRQMFGEVWEWTCSAYAPYPGFQPLQGVAGEYNGKFMVNQMVLRGGSCATPPGHLRASYRNFFPPSARWQFSGVRLARDAS